MCRVNSSLFLYPLSNGSTSIYSIAAIFYTRSGDNANIYFLLESVATMGNGAEEA